MKRYDVEGYNFDIEESKDGYYILYNDFVDLISAKIEEIEKEFSICSNKIELHRAITELRKLIKT